MKRFLQGLLIVVGALIAIFIIGGFLIPQEWSVSRSKVISASPELIYPQVANLKNWQRWAPWTLEKDPTQVYSYEGPEMGAGAKWNWVSQKMGKGHLQLKEADPKKGIVYELFIDMNDMQSTMKGVMAFKEKNGETEVVWTDSGDSGNNLIKRWMSLLIGKMLGEEMETGLSKLKDLVEAEKLKRANESAGNLVPNADVEEVKAEPEQN
jgi:hypothetical protein